MRFILAAGLLLALCACGEASAPAQAARAPAPEMLLGLFRASSNTARGITGDVTIERGGLMFQSGVIAYTRVLAPRHAGDLIARSGDSYAAAALGPGNLIIELRRVTEQTVPRGQVGLCGATPPQYIALAYEARATSVKLLAFSGDEPPGPDATRSRLCATFGYDAPAGARTREGVVL
jgi:hypothetical protein